MTAGELNYSLCRHIERYVESKGESYQTYNDILGAFEGAKLELYRTLIGPYEQAKALVNGALPSQPDRAWAAGFFDGEGNINHTIQRKRDGSLRSKGRMQITVAQKEPLLLLRFKEAVGGIGKLSAPTGQTTCWHYRISRFDDMLFVIQTLWPYLGPIKRRQALGCLTQWRDARGLDLPLPAELEEWPV